MTRDWLCQCGHAVNHLPDYEAVVDALDQSQNVLYAIRNYAAHHSACRFAMTFDGIEAHNQPCDCGFDKAEDAYESAVDANILALRRLRGES